VRSVSTMCDMPYHLSGLKHISPAGERTTVPMEISDVVVGALSRLTYRVPTPTISIVRTVDW
jgi:hypothetical protein